MMRTAALEAVGGFRDDLIAGEEPELCVRLRAKGWRIWRLDTEMALHDAAMTRFQQWWRRTMRTGYAFAQGAYLHGARPERHWIWESRRAWLWGSVAAAGLLGDRAGIRPLGLGRVADLSTANATPNHAQFWSAEAAHSAGAVPDAFTLSRGVGPDQILCAIACSAAPTRLIEYK